MKYVLFAIVLILSLNVSAQNEVFSNTFIRVYDLDGKKTDKGKIKAVSENSIELYLNGETKIVPLNKIGKIKTKRSGGNNVAKGAIIGGGSFAFIGLLSGDDDEGFFSFSATDKAALGLIGGGLLGAIVGGITTIFKKSKRYIVDGNEIELKNFKEEMIRLEGNGN